MKKVLFIFLIFCFNLNIISCSSSSDEDDLEESTTTDNDTTTDTTAATLAEVTAVTTLTNDTTPDYTFSSSEAGTITYGGSCSSSTTSATTGNNTITFNALAAGTYVNCTITVTDSAGNASSTLSVNTFVVDTTAPTVSSISTTADNQSLVTITDNITVTFSESMEPSYVTTTTSDTNCAGSIRVSSDNYSTCVKMSSEPLSSNSNRTFTLDPYDNLTVGSTYLTRVTTGVKDTAGNALSSQYETSSGFTTGNNWQLIARQVDSDNFTDGTHELFLDNASTTYLQNENDNSSSTFMSIGNLTPSNYVSDGKYKFRLEWDGKTAASLDNKSVIWTQTSWLTDSTVAGFQEIGTSGYVDNSSKGFAGLEKSGIPTSCVIDGNPGGWFHCVGAIVRWQGGIPAPKGTVASSMHLYIWAPEIKETNFALDFDGTNDYVSANGVATELDSSTNLPLSVSAWVYPENGTKEQLVFGFYRNTNSFKNGPSVWFGGSNYKFAYYNDSFTTVHSSSTYAINNWHHVVLTIGSDRDGVLYVNGSSALTFSGALNSGGLDMFSIGVDYDTSGGSAGNLTQYFD